jgi:predicted CoA-binding protein
MKILIPDGVILGADPVAEILKRNHTIGVVGLSSNPSRPSHGVSEYMQSVGYRIIPVNPHETEVLGEKSYAHLENVPEQIEIVDVFRRPAAVPAVVDSAIRIGAKVVWMQLDIEHPQAAEKARTAGIIVVMDACILVEHKRRRQI